MPSPLDFYEEKTRKKRRYRGIKQAKLLGDVKVRSGVATRTFKCVNAGDVVSSKIRSHGKGVVVLVGDKTAQPTTIKQGKGLIVKMVRFGKRRKQPLSADPRHYIETNREIVDSTVLNRVAVTNLSRHTSKLLGR